MKLNVNKLESKLIPEGQKRLISNNNKVSIKTKTQPTLYNSTLVLPKDNTKISVNPKIKNVTPTEEFLYKNPEIEKGISSGSFTQDLLYKNQYLLKAPIIGNLIKSKAKSIALNSFGRSSLSHISTEDYKNKYSPKLINQYFDGKSSLKESKYTPKSNYLSFLKSYSLKNDTLNKGDLDPLGEPRWTRGNKGLIKKNYTINEAINKQISELVGKDSAVVYDNFLKNKNMITKLSENNSPLQKLSMSDLGGHKTGLAWDTEKNLPYVSISDSWDFEPNNYSKKYSQTSIGDGYSPKAKKNEIIRQRAKIQSTLMHKIGNPFKIYDRYYFDPITKQYIPE